MAYLNDTEYYKSNFDFNQGLFLINLQEGYLP